MPRLGPISTGDAFKLPLPPARRRLGASVALLGHLLAVDRAGARLLRSADPSAGSPSFVSVGGDSSAHDNAAVRSLAVAAGHVHTASMAGGVSRAAPRDAAPPTAPGTPVADGVTSASASSSWAPAPDDVAVTGYEVLRDDAVVGVRIRVGGQLVVDHWTPHTLAENRGTVQLTADRAHDVRIEFQERTGSATMRLLRTGPGVSRQVVPSARLLAG